MIVTALFSTLTLPVRCTQATHSLVFRLPSLWCREEIAKRRVMIMVVRRGMGRYVAVCRGLSRYGAVWGGMSRYGAVRRGKARYVVVCRGLSRFVAVCRGMSHAPASPRQPTILRACQPRGHKHSILIGDIHATRTFRTIFRKVSLGRPPRPSSARVVGCWSCLQQSAEIEGSNHGNW